MAMMPDDVRDDSTVLVVDDNPVNIDIIVEALGDNYNLLVATNGREALEAVSETIPDLILLDVMMPGMDGFEVCTRLKQQTRTKEVPIIFLTALTDIDQKTKGFSLGAVDYITKPFNIQEVSARVEAHLAAKLGRDLLQNQKKILERMVIRRTREIAETQDVTIRMAASLAETRDNETGSHILRTQRYVKVLAGELAPLPSYAAELTEDRVALLVKSAPLHDIGKIGVPDAILLKPGKLEPEEFDEMKRHTIYGSDALLRAEESMDRKISRDSFLRYAREIARSHHEKWDGSGYPDGLAGEAIPLSGRIMAIADVYDALISTRVYKPPFSHLKACSIISEGGGSHFDPGLTATFEKVKDQFRDIALEFCSTREERVCLLDKGGVPA